MNSPDRNAQERSRPANSESDRSRPANSDLSPLTPRHFQASQPGRGARMRRIKRWLAAATSMAMAVAVLLLIFNLLGDAALFFYNVDEAIERRPELGERRFKVQGTPLNEPVAKFADDKPALSFRIGFNNAEMHVLHVGDPPDLFQPGVPIVLEGKWRRDLDGHLDVSSGGSASASVSVSADGGSASASADGGSASVSADGGSASASADDPAAA